jgi:uncharacterized membrane protein YhhN
MRMDRSEIKRSFGLEEDVGRCFVLVVLAFSIASTMLASLPKKKSFISLKISFLFGRCVICAV